MWSHKIKKWITLRDVYVLKIHTNKNATDMLTKLACRDKFKHCLDLTVIYSLW